MTDELSLDQAKLLTKIAKRKNSNIAMWYELKLHSEVGDEWICHICQQLLRINETFREIDIHGIKHLKDSNLLPFL